MTNEKSEKSDIKQKPEAKKTVTNGKVKRVTAGLKSPGRKVQLQL